MRSPQRLRRVSTLTARKLGNWDGAIQYIKQMGHEVHKAAVKAQWDEAVKLRQVVIKHILAQDLNWEPLAKSTQARKRYNKDKAYIDTEKYLENIRVWKAGDRVFAGVKKGVVYKRGSNSVTLDQVAIWMEYGTVNVPARPLWRPSIDEIGGARGIRDNIAEAIYRRLKWLSRGKPIQVTKKQIRGMFKANARITKY